LPEVGDVVIKFDHLAVNLEIRLLKGLCFIVFTKLLLCFNARFDVDLVTENLFYLRTVYNILLVNFEQTRNLTFQMHVRTMQLCEFHAQIFEADLLWKDRIFLKCRLFFFAGIVGFVVLLLLLLHTTELNVLIFVYSKSCSKVTRTDVNIQMWEILALIENNFLIFIQIHNVIDTDFTTFEIDLT
jgi:hypothetical protein